ncbi:THO complex 7 [Mycena indigotica]|uniref:THO complex 7 n=1 Tax=Mycena indigotica TaxID=2126181 RepID=A0A8H6W189_9AGAR|nr:THO complex 7 [Mycena indigotica]KAF7301814.1 THO complex 7 [Mycena indigotica]
MASQSTSIVPLTAEEEDRIILERITNDERPLRRVMRKLQNYHNVAYPHLFPYMAAADASGPTVDNAKEALIIELASFRLMLRKGAMICEAEARQVEEYKKEKERIDLEHGTLRGQIEQLKTNLEREQMRRRRKMEYDFVAEKVNTLPSREELEASIHSLENDMTTIRAEHEAQDKAILAQQAALDQIIENLEALRALGRGVDQDIALVAGDATADTPAPEEAPTEAQTTEKVEEAEEGEDESNKQKTEDDDIEMGELEEPEKKGKKKRDEELEEGEASDSSDLSSILSDVPENI